MSFKTVLVIFMSLLLLYAMFTVGLPFLLALVVALVLEPCIQGLMHIGRMNRFIAASLLSTLFTITILLLFYLIGFHMVTEVIYLGQKTPAYVSELHLYFEQAAARTQLFYQSLSPDMAEQIQLWLERGAASLAGTLHVVLTDISGVFLNAAGKIPSLFIIFIVFVIALYIFTITLPLLRSSFLSIFDPNSQLKMDQVLLNLKEAMFGYIRAQMLMATMTYLVTFIGLLIIDADYPLAVSVLVMLMEFVPVLGTGLVFIPWAAYHLLLGNTSFGVEIVVLFMVLTVFRRIVEPKIISDAVGINALSALISLYVGFELMGVIGLFLGPMVVILVQVMRKAGLLQISIKLD